MRAHQQQQREKRESTSSPPAKPSPQPPTASPTSVIVPPRGSLEQRPNSAFSAIIRHTSSPPGPELARDKELISSMVIRTSVISPNPKHIARFADKQQPQQPQQPSQPFDFNDPTRVSAFTRPQSMTLNLAIA